MPLEPGAVLEGTITGITAFGAFVSLGDGQTGLVHISEVADNFVKDINEHLKKGQKVMVKVISVDERNKVKLSIRQATPKTQKPVDIDWEREKEKEVKKKPTGFEDQLTKYLKDADEKWQVIKKGSEPRRRRTGYSRRKDNVGMED